MNRVSDQNPLIKSKISLRMGCCESVKQDSDDQYDSTWETEDEENPSKQVLSSKGQQDRSKHPANKKNSHQHQKANRSSKQKHWLSPFQTRRAYRNLSVAKELQCYRHKSQAVLQQLKKDNDEHKRHKIKMMRLSATEFFSCGFFCGDGQKFKNGRERERVQDESEPLRNKVGKKRQYTEMSHDDDDDLPNLQFYRNKIRSFPDGVTIDDIHNNWCGDYQKLENVHTIIQWLFPLQEQGVNPHASALTVGEIKLFHEDDKVKENLLRSYRLMLRFYGIKLLNEETGEVDRRRNWKERFDNLNRNSHNNLRITRILKCLGLLGFSHYQEPLVRFFLNETLVRQTLPRVKRSVLDYFMFTVLEREKRRKLIEFAFKHFEPKEDFVWCPEKIQRKLLQDFNRASTHRDVSCI